MAARLQAAHRADGNLTAVEDVAVEAEARALARFRKAAGFQTDDGGDREGIVHFKEIDVGGCQLGLLEGLARRAAHRFQRQQVVPIVQRQAVGGDARCRAL